jgi:hypothetical protein
VFEQKISSELFKRLIFIFPTRKIKNLISINKAFFIYNISLFCANGFLNSSFAKFVI